MIPDLLPDYMGHLGISKLGHLMIIKKRARELLYPSKERGTTGTKLLTYSYSY